MAFTKQHNRNVLMVERFAREMLERSAQSKSNADDISLWLQEFFEQMEQEDFFGTEGQCDPRGDMRTKQWTITKVEGID